MIAAIAKTNTVHRDIGFTKMLFTLPLRKRVHKHAFALKNVIVTLLLTKYKQKTPR